MELASRTEPARIAERVRMSSGPRTPNESLHLDANDD
jgi:hypothetical protein